MSINIGEDRVVQSMIPWYPWYLRRLQKFRTIWKKISIKTQIYDEESTFEFVEATF